MNKILLVGGALLLFVSLIILPRSLTEFHIKQSGQLVTVQLLKLPPCNYGYRNKFMTLKFNNANYTIRVKCKYTRNLTEGATTRLLHKPGSDIFVFQQEDTVSELLSDIAIGIIGLLIITIALFKIRKDAHNTRLAKMPA